MSLWQLVLRSLRHHWRIHVGVGVGAAVATAVLTGALFVGDSVRSTLGRQALERIGDVELAVDARDRFVRDALAEAMQERTGVLIAPVVRLGAVASSFDGSARVGGVQVLGVDGRFFDLATTPLDQSAPGDGEMLLDTRLAARLGAEVGDEFLLRVAQPSAMPRDLVVATTDDVSLALRVRVSGIVPEASFGRFGLTSSQLPPLNAYVSLPWLQRQLDIDERSNLLLIGGDVAGSVDVEAADAALRAGWRPDDLALRTTGDPERGTVDVLSDRIFIDDPVSVALQRGGVPSVGILTYFVNELRAGDRATPYSMVSAIGVLSGGDEQVSWPPAALADDEMIISAWLAKDLDVAEGDAVDVLYFVPGPSSRLVERTSTFTVRAIVPIEGWAADRTLMPAFPGLADAESCRDWDPGIPVDLERIREKDETYWDDHRGTPKAFVSLTAGQRMWGNRFGSLTAIRVPVGASASIDAALREHLDPASVGLYAQDVRRPALAASATPTDFGGLFLGLSIFLVAAALLLACLLFVLGVDQRRDEAGTLLAIGFSARRVRTVFLLEVIVVSIVAAAVGALLGVAYTRLVLAGLGRLWPAAVGFAAIEIDARFVTALIGAAGTILAVLVAVWYLLRRQMRRPAVELLASSAGVSPREKQARPRFWMTVAIVATLAAGAIVLTVDADGGMAAAGVFFGAGALLLVASLAACRVILTPPRTESRGDLSITGLAIRNARRRGSRSLATIALLACGGFLVIAIGAYQLDALQDAGERGSGTGGFALVGQATLGVLHDFETPEGRDALGLSTSDLDGVGVVPFRVRDGDDASCLNLTTAQRPRLVGVVPERLADRHAFTFARTISDADATWRLLEADFGDRVVPAIGDHASVAWALHKRVGDSIEYLDERGVPFEVRIVGTVTNSILQGNLVVSEANFKRMFPGESGHRMFLIDAPAERPSEVAATLSRALTDVGLEVRPAVDRLAEFNDVQNTYLAIFQTLGGLGLLLGSAGLGAVVARNVIERRGELALLRAVGFRRRVLRRLVFGEHVLLMVLGLACAAVSGLIAIVPAARSPGASVPVGPTVVLLLVILLSGAGWTWLAVTVAIRGPLLDDLRGE